MASLCKKKGSSRGGEGVAFPDGSPQAAMDMELELEHGGGEEEEARSESSKRSLSASSDATVSSTASKLQALRFAEDLSLPSVRSPSSPNPFCCLPWSVRLIV